MDDLNNCYRYAKTLCWTCWLFNISFSLLAIPNFTRDIDPWMLPLINYLIHYIFVYLITGKFPLLVSVLWYPTRCNFTMHCLQNILDTFIIPRGPRAYLSNHRGVISHLRTLGYTHTLKPPSDCRFDTQLRLCRWQYQSNSSSMHNPNNDLTKSLSIPKLGFTRPYYYPIICHSFMLT